ncbi:recombinase family protein [Longicatena caecimuris]|uniref:recombinase family protein n=1 Tax=Longicatena caecimuris TaxID=1796635 RepID=UPI003AB7F49E
MYGLSSDFQKRDVAIYARVSTEHEAQLSALENQIDWYKPILAARPDWTLTAQYIDEGITGTSAEKRPQFMKMIDDARQKKFNMIITREVSRFARNTVDTLQYTRLLKEYGVEVFFINDNIKTFDGDGELRLTIMATLAQDESRKTSIRVKAGQETSMKNGVFYGTGNILGYDRKGKDMVINEEQAKTVRMIYDMYLSGMGVTAIQYELEKAGRLTATGKTKWHASYLSHMLKNSFYCGIITYHKEYTPDYLKQKKIKNYGDIEYLTVKGKHTPIVTEEEFNQVQKIMNAKSRKMKNLNKGKHTVGYKPHTTAYGRLMICQCGNKFNQRFHTRDGRTDGVDYQCYTSVNRGSIREREKRGLSVEGHCDSPFIQGWKLEMMAEKIFDRYIDNADAVMDLSYSMLEKHIADQEDTPDYTEEIKHKESEIERLSKKRVNLIEMRAEGDIDKEFFRERKQEIENRIAILTEEIKTLQPDETKQSPQDYMQKLQELRERLKEYTGFEYSVIPESIVEAFIEKIWVSKDEFRWYLRSGNGSSDEFDIDDHIKIASFTLTIDDAKKYLYSFSTRRRVYNWQDLNVSIWI